MLKFGTPTIAPPLAIKKCTVQTGCTVYIYIYIYIYIGGILRTPTQNLSYIYRKDFAYPTQNLRRVGGILCTDCTEHMVLVAIKCKLVHCMHMLSAVHMVSANTWSEVLTHGPGSNKV